MRDQTRTELAPGDFVLQHPHGVRIQAMHLPFRVDGRKALVTGGASGIGAATCRALTAAGAQVTIADIDQPAAEALSRELPGASVLILDITDEAAVQAAFGQIAALDILVNNAGIGLVGGVEQTDLADFERLFRVNVQGMFLVTRVAMPLLLASRGSMVNIGSVAGLVGVKKRFAYCATKGAVIAMTRQLAVDYPTEIRANCICPGTVDTPFVEAYLEKYHRHEKEKVRAELNQRQPVGRLGRPEEIANMVLYLCSTEAEFVNGAVMAIDGGWTAA
jgi:NAD(P)-dependent dehydrogenase (short-subunit alcohol dehydrogenase family)